MRSQHPAPRHTSPPATSRTLAGRHGRKVGGAPRRGRKSAASANDGTSAKEIRDWARSNGHKVNERGRVPADIVAAYEKSRA